MKRVGQSHSEFLVSFNFKLILFSYFNSYFWRVNFIHFRSFRIHSADFLRTYFFFSLPVCSFFVLSLSSANHGHLTKVTSAWLTCKLHGCNLFKTSASLRTIKANLKSGLEELLVVHCCCLMRVSRSCLFFPCEGAEIALSNRSLCRPRKTFCGCPNFREIISV